MKPALIILLLILSCSTGFAAKIKVEGRGNFIRIEDTQRGAPYIVYLNRNTVLSVTLAKSERNFRVEIVTRELVSSGNSAVNKSYLYLFFSEAEAEGLINDITNLVVAE
jgi:hypothetical protein